VLDVQQVFDESNAGSAAQVIHNLLLCETISFAIWRVIQSAVGWVVTLI
jgi:hypothetical protein